MSDGGSDSEALEDEGEPNPKRPFRGFDGVEVPDESFLEVGEGDTEGCAERSEEPGAWDAERSETGMGTVGADCALSVLGTIP